MIISDIKEFQTMKQNAKERAKLVMDEVKTEMSPKSFEMSGWSAEKWEEETTKVFYESEIDARKYISKPSSKD